MIYSDFVGLAPDFRTFGQSKRKPTGDWSGMTFKECQREKGGRVEGNQGEPAMAPSFSLESGWPQAVHGTLVQVPRVPAKPAISGLDVVHEGRWK